MRERDSENSRPAILHVDTGMSRLGLTAREFAGLADDLPRLGIGWRAVMSHLACADTADHPLNERQPAPASGSPVGQNPAAA
jgi:alanine racemase